jgi:hypothetical protein
VAALAAHQALAQLDLAHAALPRSGVEAVTHAQHALATGLQHGDTLAVAASMMTMAGIATLYGHGCVPSLPSPPPRTPTSGLAPCRANLTTLLGVHGVGVSHLASLYAQVHLRAHTARAAAAPAGAPASDLELTVAAFCQLARHAAAVADGAGADALLAAAANAIPAGHSAALVLQACRAEIDLQRSLWAEDIAAAARGAAVLAGLAEAAAATDGGAAPVLDAKYWQLRADLAARGAAAAEAVHAAAADLLAALDTTLARGAPPALRAQIPARRVAVLLLQGTTCSLAGAPVRALDPLLAAASLAEELGLAALNAAVGVALADVQLSLGLAAEAAKTAATIAQSAATHGSTETLARAHLLAGRALLLGADGEAPATLSQAYQSLQLACRGFKALGARAGHREALQWLAVTAHRAGNRPRRDYFSKASLALRPGNY